jgi:hypothetical protein
VAETLHRLPDQQLLELLERAGGERFLAGLPGSDRSKPVGGSQDTYREVNREKAGGRGDVASNGYQYHQQLQEALRTPGQRDYLMHSLASYLLNTFNARR